MRHPPGSHLQGWLIVLIYALCAPMVAAQLSFDTDSVAPQRFVAVHGHRAVVMGYAASGLELWAYPLQLVSGYELGFQSVGETSEVKASTLLRRVTYEPEAITRTYIGPDFVVRERLFVPLDDAAVLLTYSVECRHSIDVVIHFVPVLDLMWPASVGGQNTHWDPAASAYLLAEPTHRYHALIGSRAVVSHDEVLNSAQPGTLGKQFAFAVRAGGSANPSATVVVARNDEGSSPAARMENLLGQQAKFENQARAHYAQLLAGTLRIETPDDAVNRQLAWAQIALDQAWVCNQLWGCGLVAGYGPSRGARRPQYAWFFAGDALIAIDALVSSGDYSKAQGALAFIAKYQDARTGMIWHEISQSADPAGWATAYPYMFVHVDITFHYLVAVERYVSASGDVQFLRQNWPGLEAAYRYCESLLNQDDGLPRIPPAKEGGNEQDKMTDDVDLSVSWVRASAAFARLATLSGHPRMADEAMQCSQKASSSAAHRYWDDQRNSWIDGYDGSGHAVFRQSDDGIRLVTERILDRRQSASILDRLASSDFETDWGTRGVAASGSRFDPSSYASGSVSAIGTAGVASAFWAEHRPYTALPIWSSLVAWGTLDSLGHMHEVLAGDSYHQQEESVPEQTWSSAAFLSSTIHGLLGLVVEGPPNRLEFSPHLPPGWDKISIKNIKVSGGQVNMILSRVSGGLDLETENSGSPIELFFSPQIPLGAHLQRAELDGKPIEVRREAHEQDTHATLKFTLAAGRRHCLVLYEGGVSVNVVRAAPLVGNASQALKVTSIAYKASSLVLEADVRSDASDLTIELRAAEKPLKVQGARLMPVSPGLYELTVDRTAMPTTPVGQYRHTQVVIDFPEKKREDRP